MSLLSELLQAKEPLLDESLRQLESASHKQGVDTKLIANIHQGSVAAMRSLGLDVRDTTGPELYHALLARAQTDNAHLHRVLSKGMQKPGLPELIKKTLDISKIPREAWVLKKSVAKELLRKMPPKDVMKLLGYRSVDSMLKREKLPVLFGALRFVQPPEWLNAFNKSYEKLTPSDFETRQIEVVALPADPWLKKAMPFIRKKQHNLTHLKELGVIVVLPETSGCGQGGTLWSVALVLHYVNEIRLYSAFFKLQQVKGNFGEVLAQTLNADPDLGPIMAGQKIHWRVIQRYFSKLEEYHPEIFEPHVQPEDLHWRRAEEVLFGLDPELGFWKGLDFVAIMQDGRPTSFNLLDVVASLCNSVPYSERTIYHFRESLWNEIFTRYMGQKILEQQVLKHLNNAMIVPPDVG